jgi:6-phosphogluconolactonase
MLYVGTYSARGSEGIYALDFDARTGAVSNQRHVAGLRNPSFLALHPREPWLYAVSEAEGQGAVAAIALPMGPGPGAILNQESTRGVGPCHVAVDPTGHWVASANYVSGSVCLHAIQADGTLAPPADVAQHTGSGPNSRRQEGPHAHSVTFDPSGTFIIAADLGIDRMLVYLLDRDRGKLVPHDPAGLSVKPGAGPRHFAFHPTGEFAYVINELDNTVVACAWDAVPGKLSALQTLSTLPPDFAETSYCADIHVHPNGRYLYGTNRGHDSLAVFAIDPRTGVLEAMGHVSTGGRNPRNFTITADGEWLLAANQDTDNIVVFRVREDGATLEPVGDHLSIPAPVCLVFGN